MLAVGFAARVAAGPRFSLLGRLATQVIAPWFGPPRLVPGPPKRFAQTIGLALTTAAVLAGPVLGADLAARVLIGVLIVFATLESVVGFCAGCWLFGRLMDWGVDSRVDLRGVSGLAGVTVGRLPDRERRSSGIGRPFRRCQPDTDTVRPIIEPCSTRSACTRATPRRDTLRRRLLPSVETK